jgi:hypothetical protein
MSLTNYENGVLMVKRLKTTVLDYGGLGWRMSRRSSLVKAAAVDAVHYAAVLVIYEFEEADMFWTHNYSGDV